MRVSAGVFEAFESLKEERGPRRRRGGGGFSRGFPRFVWHFFPGRKSLEVDILAEVHLRLIPFEVKYSRSPVQESDLKGLRILCEEKEIPRGYVITRQISDFGVETFPGKLETAILKIPAPLACYWLSRSEGRS